jgi:hypothetical protein
MSTTKPRKLTPRQEASSADTTPERLKELAQDPKLARLVAANTSAPAALLLALSHSDDKAVRKACTTNANTPVEALLKLGSQFPEQLLENPVFDLLLLAHPGLLEELSTATLNSLLKRDQVPVELIRWAWKHRSQSTLHSLLMNPNNPADVVDELCKSKDPEVRIAAELHCTKELPGWAQGLKAETDLYSTRILASMLSMATSSWWDELLDILPLASSKLQENCVIEFLPRSHLISKVRGSSSPTLLALLSHAKDWEVLNALSSNSSCPIEALERLAQVSDKCIRANVANHNGSSTKILATLSEDLIWEVRMHVAANTAANAEALCKLSMDVIDEVRAAVAANECAPESVLTTLSRDQSSLVREKAASNERIPTQILATLAHDDEARVRMRVALNLTTPGVARIRLRHHDNNIEVREYALLTLSRQQRKVPPKGGTQVDSCHVRQIASKRANADGKPETVKKLTRILEEALLGSQPSSNRRFLLSLSQCPINILAKNFRSRCWLERFAIAGNPSTPEAVLERMANEGNQLVRRAARTNLEARTTGQPDTDDHGADQP